MGFFSKLFGKISAEKSSESQFFTSRPEYRPDVTRYAENQNGSGETDLELVEDMVQQIFEDEDQFITLSLEAPIHDGVRFVQACRIPAGIYVQLGIGEGNQTQLMERICSEDECMHIFRVFFDTLKVEDIECYTPVQRM